MNSGYREIIETIRAKIVRLNSAYQHQKHLNNELTEENSRLKHKNTELKNQVDGLINEMETLKLTSSFNKTDEMKKEAEGQIDNLIREIDNCITLINRM